MSVLITGARGQVGQGVLGRLAASGFPVRAASARPAELAVPDGVETVEMVLDRPETFGAALDGVRQVFLYPEPAGIDELIKAAEAAGVEHVVLLSSAAVLGPDAETHPIGSHNLRVERALADSTLTVTVLRPDAFASNSLGWAWPIGQSMPVALAYPDARIAPIHPDDIADIAAEALTGGTLAGRTVTLTGAESLSFREQLAILSDETGREIPVERISRGEAEQQMGKYLPDRMVTALLDLWASAQDGPAEIADTTASLLGQPARSYRQWARENAAAFGAE
ncbi:SDR family oxidoreductase [Streptomyces sp. NPDC051561]|uniref:SDR family oxidoreductase n=1 Tax=Streptomyces sp. NPDC051561 TaxID=3365658 RepID=UPI0037A26604